MISIINFCRTREISHPATIRTSKPCGFLFDRQHHHHLWWVYWPAHDTGHLSWDENVFGIFAQKSVRSRTLGTLQDVWYPDLSCYYYAQGSIWHDLWSCVNKHGNTICKSVVLKGTAGRLGLFGPSVRPAATTCRINIAHAHDTGGTMLLPTLENHENNSQQSSLCSRTGMLIKPSSWYLHRPSIHTSGHSPRRKSIITCNNQCTKDTNQNRV